MGYGFLQWAPERCVLWVVDSRDHVGCGLWVPLWVVGSCSGLLRDVGCGLCVLERCGLWVVGSIVGCLQWAPERCGLWVPLWVACSGLLRDVGCGFHCGLLAVCS